MVDTSCRWRQTPLRTGIFNAGYSRRHSAGEQGRSYYSIILYRYFFDVISSQSLFLFLDLHWPWRITLLISSFFNYDFLLIILRLPISAYTELCAPLFNLPYMALYALLSVFSFLISGLKFPFFISIYFFRWYFGIIYFNGEYLQWIENLQWNVWDKCFPLFSTL